MRVLFSLLLLVVGSAMQAQFRFEEDRSIPVTLQGNELPRAWEGGINAAQFQKMDLNSDGNEDLVIYHRISGELSTYLAENGAFIFNPDYKAFFPEEVTDWFILADYNCDGRKDIFTSTPLGITVFENTTTGDVPEWTQAVEFIAFDNDINLQVNASDIPGIADIDGDGDLDIISYRFSTSNTIDYYRNLSIENTGACGELTFTRETRRWGDLEECDCNSFAFGQTCASLGGIANPGSLANAPQAAEHAGGKTLLPLDFDNDGDMDLITSDEFCETLYYMENVGDAQLAVMTSFTEFPPGNAASFYIFPSAFYEDINFDGNKDLLISSNADNNIGNLIDFTSTSRINFNQGTTDAPVFEGNFAPFLQQEMIDLGETTYPALADVDNDSDLDLIVGNRGTIINGELTATLTLFENTGTRLLPAFNITDADFLNFSSQGFRSLKPQFIDLDNDGDLDLTYQATEIDGNRTALRYRINTGNFTFSDENEINLNLLENDQFHFSRIDGDNEIDLLIGNRLGSITLYLNEGSLSFGEGQDDFGGIANGFNTRNPSLLVSDLNNDGIRELLTTNVTGTLTVLSGELNAGFSPDNTVTEILANSLTEDSQSTRLGEFTPITSGDLFGTGLPAIVIGNNRGGLSILRNLSTDGPGSGERLSVLAFPNPSTELVTLQSNRQGVLDIYNLKGQRVQQGITIRQADPLEVDTSQFPAGLYLIRVKSTDNQVRTLKLLVEH